MNVGIVCVCGVFGEILTIDYLENATWIGNIIMGIRGNKITAKLIGRKPVHSPLLRPRAVSGHNMITDK